MHINFLQDNYVFYFDGWPPNFICPSVLLQPQQRISLKHTPPSFIL